MNPQTIYYVFTVPPHDWWRAVMYTTERGKAEMVHVATTTEGRTAGEKFCEEHSDAPIEWDRSDMEMSIGKVIR